MGRVTRREFLRRAAGLAAGVELGRHLAGGGGLPAALAETATPPAATVTPSVLAATATTRPAGLWPMAAVVQGTNADTAAAILKTALDAVGGMARFVKPGQTVAVKPNCTWDYPPNTASSTDPELLRAVILAVREAGAKRIIVLDHPTISSASSCLETSGIGRLLDQLDVEKVFPDRTLAPADTYTVIDLPKGKSYQKMGVLKAAVEADVRINMAVAKSHVVLPVTLCLKHMMGFLENPPALHAYLEQGVTDINTESAIQASLHILEAIRVRLKGMAAGVETDLTNPRLVKRFNQIAVGTDPVLIDAYACINYFGRQPKEVRYIKLAGDQGLGELDVKKATEEGRLRVLKVGQALSTPTPTATTTATQTPAAGAKGAGATATATAQPTVGTPSPTLPPPTATPLPTVTPEPTGLAPLPAAGANAAAPGAPGLSACAVSVDSPNRFLSGALLPVAAVVTGAGLVVGRRLHKKEQAAPEAQGAPEQPGSSADAGAPALEPQVPADQAGPGALAPEAQDSTDQTGAGAAAPEAQDDADQFGSGKEAAGE